jgi:hypothetical protein
MCRSSVPPEVCTVSQLGDWLVENDEPFAAYLKICRCKAAQIVAPIHDLPSVRTTRGCWQSDRPFPSDEQLLLLASLLNPARQLTRLDEETVGRMEVLLCMLGLPRGATDSVSVRLAAREFTIRWTECAAGVV